MIASPLNQFKVYKLFEIELLGVDISFTNSSLFMLITLIALAAFLFFTTRKHYLVPNRWQILSETVYLAITHMLESTAGPKSKVYLPFVFSIFLFILFANTIGIIPGSFTITSHIIVTFALAAVIFIGVTIIGFINNGFGYFAIFLPKGTPLALAPLLIIIELFAYLVRPITLSVRLAANMMAGHVVLKILASFIIFSGFLGIFPLTVLTLLTGFEIFVAVLQAYIFSILTCVYLNDALNLH